MSGVQIKNTNVTNVRECDYESILRKVRDDLAICEYNYINTPKERICYGPTTKDWHNIFSCKLVETEKPSPRDPKKKIIVKSQSKNINVIELMDVLGVSLASIKQLSCNQTILEKKIENLEKSNKNISSDLNDLKLAAKDLSDKIEACNDQKKIDLLKDNVVKVQRQLGNLSTNMTNLQSQVNVLKTQTHK